VLLIDPLRIKVEDLLKAGQSYPLNQGRQRYGLPGDIESLIKYIDEQIDEQEYFIVDFTPFERIGRLEIFVNRLSKTKIPTVLLIMSENLLEELNSGFENRIPIYVILFSSDGNRMQIKGGDDSDSSVKSYIERDFNNAEGPISLSQFREKINNETLFDLLYNPFCLDIPGDADDPRTIRRDKEGRLYRVMHNEMLVTHYLNLKNFGKDPTALTKMAYTVIQEIAQNFRRDKDPFSEFDVIVTPNNTALFLASVIQAIIERPVIPVDRLGPIPRLNLQTSKLRPRLVDKKVIVFVEVIGTGSEIDRTLYFLNNVGAEITKIIGLYNLEVGKSFLSNSSQLISLCKPKDRIGYIYRSQ
jgi:hypothetical protein